MKNKTSYVSTLLFLLISLNAYAEYKTTDFSKEEYQMVVNASADYRDCLNESAMGQIEQQNDVRVIADYAMKECATVLEELYGYLVSANYAPEAVRRLVGRSSNKASNKLLSLLTPQGLACFIITTQGLLISSASKQPACISFILL